MTRETKQDFYSLGDGRFAEVSWSFPLELSQEELADVLAWLDLVKRKFARSLALNSANAKPTEATPHAGGNEKA